MAYDIPVDNSYAEPILLGDVWKQRHGDLLVVSPDVGGMVRPRALAETVLRIGNKDYSVSALFTE